MRSNIKDEVECDFCSAKDHQISFMGQAMIKPGWFLVQHFKISSNVAPNVFLDFCSQDCIERYDFNYV